MHGALQGLIAMEQPQPCSCSCARGSLSTLSAGPTRLPQQPWCCRDPVIPPPEPHFSRTQVGSLCFDSSPGPQHPPNPAVPDSPAFPASVFPTAGGSGNGHIPRPQSPRTTVPPSTWSPQRPSCCPTPHITDCAHLGRRKFGWKMTPAKGISRSWLRSLQFWLPLLLVLLSKDLLHLELLQPGHAGWCPSTSSCAAVCDLPAAPPPQLHRCRGAALFRCFLFLTLSSCSSLCLSRRLCLLLFAPVGCGRVSLKMGFALILSSQVRTPDVLTAPTPTHKPA